jgi:hypothetical protein
MVQDLVRKNEDLTKEASIDYLANEDKMVEELYLFVLQEDYKNFRE